MDVINAAARLLPGHQTRDRFVDSARAEAAAKRHYADSAADSQARTRLFTVGKYDLFAHGVSADDIIASGWQKAPRLLNGNEHLIGRARQKFCLHARKSVRLMRERFDAKLTALAEHRSADITARTDDHIRTKRADDLPGAFPGTHQADDGT